MWTLGMGGSKKTMQMDNRAISRVAQIARFNEAGQDALLRAIEQITFAPTNKATLVAPYATVTTASNVRGLAP